MQVNAAEITFLNIKWIDLILSVLEIVYRLCIKLVFFITEVANSNSNYHCDIGSTGVERRQEDQC
jgi:hypothetical protein